MKQILRGLFAVTLGVVALVGVAALFGTEAAPDRTTKSVELWCKNGWKGSGGGVYGGVSFSVSCVSDRQSVTIEGVSGTDYSVRWGVQSFSQALDCFHSGSADQVRETCGDVKLVIR